ncbi:MAG: prepilin-type N-terminal cleavage/methylation domain-containing protein [Candidatus Omnitrophica bacterium]|nr:prepilin-type N-terminal cleavage/methylation domain-containing protein [Candidatus Omnitrophota bacterium]
MRKNAGFTFMEIMIVIMIMGVLAAIAIPNFNKKMNSARVDDVVSDLRMIMEANRLYRTNEGQYLSACMGGGTTPCTCFDPGPVSVSCSFARYFNDNLHLSLMQKTNVAYTYTLNNPVGGYTLLGDVLPQTGGAWTFRVTIIQNADGTITQQPLACACGMACCPDIAQ